MTTGAHLYDVPVNRDGRKAVAAIQALKAEQDALHHIALDLLQHIDWLTCGLPAMLENAALIDEEGLIGAAVDAADSARTALQQKDWNDDHPNT